MPLWPRFICDLCSLMRGHSKLNVSITPTHLCPHHRWTRSDLLPRPHPPQIEQLPLPSPPTTLNWAHHPPPTQICLLPLYTQIEPTTFSTPDIHLHPMSCSPWLTCGLWHCPQESRLGRVTCLPSHCQVSAAFCAELYRDKLSMFGMLRCILWSTEPSAVLGCILWSQFLLRMVTVQKVCKRACN